MSNSDVLNIEVIGEEVSPFRYLARADYLFKRLPLFQFTQAHDLGHGEYAAEGDIIFNVYEFPFTRLASWYEKGIITAFDLGPSGEHIPVDYVCFKMDQYDMKIAEENFRNALELQQYVAEKLQNFEQ